MAVFNTALMAKPKTGLVKAFKSNGVKVLVHSQLSANNAKTIAATGKSFFDKGITLIFHLMKITNRMK